MSKRKTPAALYAQEYVEKVQRPLTEEDLAHAFNCGAWFGRTSAWQRIEDSTPVYCPDEKIVVLMETGRFTYDIALVPSEDYCTFISKRDNPGIPILWAYFRGLVGKRVKLPRRKNEEKNNEKYGIRTTDTD